MKMENFGDFYDQRVKATNHPMDESQMTFPPFALAPYEFVWNYFGDLNPASQVLDIGCGCGIHSFYFAKRAKFVHGVDISKNSLEIAKQKAKLLNVEAKCLFENKDFLSIENEQNKYDVLFASGVLYYFDLSKIERKVMTLLKPGGTFCAIETVGDNILLNLYRKIVNFFFKHRDQQTVNSLLKIQDIENLSKKFSSAQVYYFDFFTLFLRPVQNIPVLGKFLLNVARFADDILLNKLKLKSLSFKMVLIGKK